LALLKGSAARRLAAADLIISLCLGHLFSPMRRPLAEAERAHIYKLNFGNSISSHICRIQQCLGMRLSSTASPLPTAFLARRIRLSAGSAKRAECIDIARVFGVEGAIFEG